MLPYNETAYKYMIEILQHVQMYVPSNTVEKELILPNKEILKYTEEHYAVTLLDGDQLTVARSRGAQKIRSNSIKSENKLEDLFQ